MSTRLRTTTTAISRWALRALAYGLAAIPFVCGWVVGVGHRWTLWTIASIRAGYLLGRGL